MSTIFDITRDGASCMVEPAWMRAQQALAGASTSAPRPAGAGWGPGDPDWCNGGR